jgi:hypothetical protein
MGLSFPSCILDNASKSRWRGSWAPTNVYESALRRQLTFLLTLRPDENLPMFRQKRLRGPVWKFVDGKSSHSNCLVWP